MTKTCKKCGETKPLTPEFWTRDKKRKDGFRLDCKPCYNKWARNYSKHNQPHVRDSELSAEAVEQRRALRAKYRATYRAKKIKRWHEENGPDMPTCACGCGEELVFDSKGVLHRYKFNHHGRSDEYRVFASMFMTQFHRDKIGTDDFIEIGHFRTVCRKIKKDKGWTWAEMAHAGGLSFEHLNQLMTQKKALTVRHETAVNFLRRIVGLPAPPSTFLQRERKKDKIADAGMDTEDWTGEEEERYREKNRLREQLRRHRQEELHE
jgi:transcriptional regulator with XRE-family HTH domain